VEQTEESDMTASAHRSTLAERTRLAIVQQLASDGEVCACDFTD